MPVAYIGIGSNEGDRRVLCEAAVERVRALGRLVVRSPWYVSAPWGDTAQDDFLNGVLALNTALVPRDLLAALHAIESDLGRVRTGRRWGPRAIDLDIVLYGDVVMRSDALTIPHPHYTERAFVLAPLCDIASDLRDPVTGRTMAALYAACPDTGWVRRCDDEAVPVQERVACG